MTDERTIFDEVEEAGVGLPWDGLAIASIYRQGARNDDIRSMAWAEEYALLAANNAPAFVTALRAAEKLAELFGDYYCGSCGNGGWDDDQPYSDVTDLDSETCKHCRSTVELWWRTKRLIAAAKRGEVTDG